MINGHEVNAIIAAAGMGKRMKSNLNKQFLEIYGEKILSHSLKKIIASKYVDSLTIIIKDTDLNYLEDILKELKLKLPYKIVFGGAERQDSIYNGLLNVPETASIVLTHDGARPLVDTEKINEVIEAVFETGAATLANRVKDTIKISSNSKTVDYTPNRDELWAVQTPQVFFKNIILKAYDQAFREGYYGTDDCSLVEKTGSKVKLVWNDYKNIKITTPEDLILAEALMGCEL